MNLLFWSLHIESLEQYTSLANFVAGHEAAFLTFLLVDLLLLLVDLDAFAAHILTVLQGDFDAELIKLHLLVVVELTVLESCVVLLEFLKESVSHFIFNNKL